MPFYHKLGIVPEKRHIVSRQNNGKLYQEELVGTQGFAGLSSLVYHLHPPTGVKQKGKPYSVNQIFLLLGRQEVVVPSGL